MELQQEIERYKKIGEAKYYKSMLDRALHNGLSHNDAKRFAKRATFIIKESERLK